MNYKIIAEQAAAANSRLADQIIDLSDRLSDAHAEIQITSKNARASFEKLQSLISSLVREPNDNWWRDVSIDGYPKINQEVLVVRGGKTVWGAWLGEVFWVGGEKCACLYWMPMPEPKK